MRTLEEAAGLAAPVTTPGTTRCSLVYRVIAAVLALGRDAKEPWDARNGYDDSSGMEDSGRRFFVERFGVVRPGSPVHGESSPMGEPADACWGLHRGDEVLVVLHTAGYAFLGEEVLDLMDLYRPRRRLAPVLTPILEAMEA